MTWRIVAITEGTRLTEEGRLVRTMIVSYMVNEHGPYTVQIDKPKFTVEKAKELVAAEAEKIIGLLT